MERITTSLHALNRIEDGMTILISLPGNYCSTLFNLDSDGAIQRWNVHIGLCKGMTKSEAYEHFGKMLSSGAIICVAE